MGTINYQRPHLSAYQIQIIDSPKRFTITEAGTKTGKTSSHIIWLFEQALNGKDGFHYWWVAPVYQQAEIAFKRMRAYVNSPDFFKVNESKLRLTLPNGSVIEFKSADKPDTLYGEDVYAAVFDEFTRAKEDAWVALRSTLTATGGKCKFIGNVRGKGWGYRLGVKARSGDGEYDYFKITAVDAVKAGILKQSEIDQARKDLPDHVYRQLYMAEALDGGTNPFGSSHITACLSELSDLSPVCFGIDLGKSVDYTVVTGLDDYGKPCVFERWQADWSQTRERIRSIVGSIRGFIDSTGLGDPIAEDLMKDCTGLERFVFTSRSKQQIMEGLAKGIQTGDVGVLDGVMRDELESFEFEYTANGVRYSAPDGLHDDTVCSLALAYSSLKSATFVGVHVSGF